MRDITVSELFGSITTALYEVSKSIKQQNEILLEILNRLSETSDKSDQSKQTDQPYKVDMKSATKKTGSTAATPAPAEPTAFADSEYACDSTAVLLEILRKKEEQ